MDTNSERLNKAPSVGGRREANTLKQNVEKRCPFLIVSAPRVLPERSKRAISEVEREPSSSTSSMSSVISVSCAKRYSAAARISPTSTDRRQRHLKSFRSVVLALPSGPTNQRYGTVSKHSGNQLESTKPTLVWTSSGSISTNREITDSRSEASSRVEPLGLIRSGSTIFASRPAPCDGGT